MIFMATCFPTSSIWRHTNQHLNWTYLLPTWLNIRATPIRGTIVASTRAIATSTSLVARGVAMVTDHLSNTPFLVLASPNVWSVRYVTSKATPLQPVGFDLSKDIKQKIPQWIPTWLLPLLHQILNGITTLAPKYTLLMISPTSTCMLRITMAMTRSE